MWISFIYFKKCWVSFLERCCFIIVLVWQLQSMDSTCVLCFPLKWSFLYWPNLRDLVSNSTCVLSFPLGECWGHARTAKSIAYWPFFFLIFMRGDVHIKFPFFCLLIQPCICMKCLFFCIWRLCLNLYVLGCKVLIGFWDMPGEDCRSYWRVEYHSVSNYMHIYVILFGK